jgi:FxsC-like protein
MPARHDPYFFLSYARSNPLAGYPQTDPDRWVGKFFGDLVAAVRRHASRRSEHISGFFDQQIPVGSDWKKSLSQALGAAQVFVPLYSAGYLATSWPGREWACFRRRMELVGVTNPERRFVHVLWTPLTETQNPPGLREALALGADEPDYAENGLRALLKLRPYHDSYQVMVNLLAKQIVILAEKSPIRPSEVDIDDVESRFMPEPHLAEFAIETAAPTTRTVAEGHDPQVYGESSTEWRPFPRQKLTIAEYAGQVAERFDFEVKVGEIKTVRDQVTRRPGIILIDPWFIADESGRSALESAVDKLPRWVLPLLILDQPDDIRTRELATQVRDILRDAGALPTDSSRRAARGVGSLGEFVSLVRVLVAEAERQYLRYRSGRYRSGHVSSPPSPKRPSLRRAVRPDGSASTPDRPVSTPDPLGEAPDA